MKTTIFSNIQSLEDIQKQKLRLKKKLRLTGKSITEKSTIINFLAKNEDLTSSLFNEKNDNQDLIKYFLPLGLKYIITKIRNNPNKKLVRRVITYTLLGSLSAVLLYHLIGNRRDINDSDNQ